MSSRETSPTPITDFRLLDLPAELIERICLFVAVVSPSLPSHPLLADLALLQQQRYEYAYSRRPNISPLKVLADSSRLLNELASPFLHRRATYDQHRLHCSPVERCCRHLRNLSYLHYAHGDVDVPCWRPDIHQLSTLELRGGATPPAISSTSLATLLVRRMYAQAPEIDLPHLRSVIASHVHQSWLESLAALPSVRTFEVTVAQSAKVSCATRVSDWCGDLFEKVEGFVLEVPPATLLVARTPLELALEGLKVSSTSVTLDVALLI